jgi:capsular polysaccharide biosynthesis protein
MTSVLPRLMACARLRRQHPELCVLLPQGADAPWLAEMLALLGLEDAVEWLPDAPVACDGLVVTSRLDLATPGPYAIAAARALAALVPLAQPGARLLYVRSTATAGRLDNEVEVAATLASHGFAVLDADATSLAARIALLREARAVIGGQSPYLAEIAFCPPGAAVLELVGPADPSPVFWSIASCAGLRYGYVVGEAVGAARPGGPHAIPLTMLDPAAAMMAATATT